MIKISKNQPYVNQFLDEDDVTTNPIEKYFNALEDFREHRISLDEFKAIEEEHMNYVNGTYPFPKPKRTKNDFSGVIHFLQCAGSVILGSALFFFVTSVLVVIFTLILYYLAKIPILNFLLNLVTYVPKYLDDGYAQFRMISGAIYLPAVLISVFLLQITVNLVCFKNHKAAATAFKIIACIVIVLHAILVVYNIIGLFRGTSNYQQIITNAIWIFAGVYIWGLSED